MMRGHHGFRHGGGCGPWGFGPPDRVIPLPPFGGPGGGWRRFASRQERLADLESYEHELEAELEAVREEIERLHGEQGEKA